MDILSEKIQTTISDVVQAQQKPFYTARTSKDEVLSVESIIFLVRKLQALQTRVSLVYDVTYLQCAVKEDVPSPSIAGCTCAGLLINAHYYVL